MARLMPSTRTFTRLPLELIVGILACLSPRQLAKSCWVDKRWHNIVLGSAALWTVFDDLPADQLDTLLARSGARGVSVKITCRTADDYATACRAIRLHLSHIRQLHLIISFTFWDPCDTTPPSLIPVHSALDPMLRTPAPVLRHLRLESMSYVAAVSITGELFNSHAPLLRSVHLDGFNIRHVQPAFSGVSHFSGQGTWFIDSTDLIDGDCERRLFSHVKDLARHFPALTHLRLWDFDYAIRILGRRNNIPNGLHTLTLDYLSYGNADEADGLLAALQHAQWHSLGTISITHAPEGLLACIFENVADAESLALDSGPGGAYLEITTVSKRVLRFTAPLEDCLAETLPGALPVTEILLGPTAVEDFQLSFIARLFAVSQNVRVMTVTLPADLLDHRSWGDLNLSVPNLAELRITAPRDALDPVPFCPATICSFARALDLGERTAIPLVSLWGVHADDTAFPDCAAEWTEHKAPFVQL